MYQEKNIWSTLLTCYIALVLSSVLQHKLDKKYSVWKILESLNKCNCYQIQSNYYLFNYYDDVLNDIRTILDSDFSRKYMRLQDIKKNLGNVKKWLFSQELSETIYAPVT